MTIWAAYANFEEEQKGSIEIGKVADLVLITEDIMTINESTILRQKYCDHCRWKYCLSTQAISYFKYLSKSSKIALTCLIYHLKLFF